MSHEESKQRPDQHGPNRLAEKPPRPAWLKFIDQFRNVLTAVLVGAAVLASAVGDLKDAVVILVVVVFNAILGFYQEYRAEKTLAALKERDYDEEEELKVLQRIIENERSRQGISAPTDG